MTQKLELYRCNACGNLVEIVFEGNGELVCCNQPMQLLQAKNYESEGLEKHVPIFKTDENGNTIICVGSEPHPMTNEHYIMFIENISKDNNYIYREYLFPEMEPKIVLAKNNNKTNAREYCNIHGLWENLND